MSAAPITCPVCRNAYVPPHPSAEDCPHCEPGEPETWYDDMPAGWPYALQFCDNCGVELYGSNYGLCGHCRRIDQDDINGDDPWEWE